MTVYWLIWPLISLLGIGHDGDAETLKPNLIGHWMRCEFVKTCKGENAEWWLEWLQVFPHTILNNTALVEYFVSFGHIVVSHQWAPERRRLAELLWPGCCSHIWLWTRFICYLLHWRASCCHMICCSVFFPPPPLAFALVQCVCVCV